MLVDPVILVLMGAGFLVSGQQGLRLDLDEEHPTGLGQSELNRRRIMVRAGSYACIASGTTLVLLAVLVTYALFRARIINI
jgi:hypothetical protein